MDMVIVAVYNSSFSQIFAQIIAQIFVNFSQIFCAKLCVFVMSKSQTSSFAENRSFLINNGVFPPSLMSKDIGKSIQTSSSHDAEDSHAISGFHQITPISLMHLFSRWMASENCENPEKYKSVTKITIGRSITNSVICDLWFSENR